jgi:hypothetical protein
VATDRLSEKVNQVTHSVVIEINVPYAIPESYQVHYVVVVEVGSTPLKPGRSPRQSIIQAYHGCQTIASQYR